MAANVESMFYVRERYKCILIKERMKLKNSITKL